MRIATDPFPPSLGLRIVHCALRPAAVVTCQQHAVPTTRTGGRRVAHGRIRGQLARRRGHRYEYQLAGMFLPWCAGSADSYLWDATLPAYVFGFPTGSSGFFWGMASGAYTIEFMDAA